MSTSPSFQRCAQRRVSHFLGLAIASLLGSQVALARAEGAGFARLGAALQAGEAEAVALTWTRGRPDAPQTRLRIEGGRASLRQCEVGGACQDVGAALTLSGGQKAQLLSALRSASFATLRTSDADAVALADRALELSVAGTSVGTWQLSRGEWPVAPDGSGTAEFLDELAGRIQQAASARTVVPIPRTVADLQGVRVQLRLSPRKSPGGLLVVEHGQAQISPEEGSLARTPRPRPFTRPLTPGEQEQLVQALQAASLDELDAKVPKRAAPAIGDDDGRVATLHLMPAEDALAKSPPLPRGYERYLADMQRGPAAPLMTQLVGWLMSPPPASGSPKSRALPTAKNK